MTPSKSIEFHPYVYINTDASSASPSTAERDVLIEVDEMDKDLEESSR
jgi:hypothetical protein